MSVLALRNLSIATIVIMVAVAGSYVTEVPPLFVIGIFLAGAGGLAKATSA